MTALLTVWRIEEAGTPAARLPESAVVVDVEALCRGVIAELRRTDPLPHTDVEETLGFQFEQVVVLTAAYDPTRAGILFRPWLYQKLRWKTIDFWREFFGRRGQKRVFDSSAWDQSRRDRLGATGDYDSDTRNDRLAGPAAEGEGDRPEDRTSPLEWLYARGDRATLREERRLGFYQGARAQAGDLVAGDRTAGRPRPGAAGGAGGAHWADCPECGWRNFRTVAPNGLPGWRFPDRCVACGAGLEELACVA